MAHFNFLTLTAWWQAWGESADTEQVTGALDGEKYTFCYALCPAPSLSPWPALALATAARGTPMSQNTALGKAVSPLVPKKRKGIQQDRSTKLSLWAALAWGT